jgi:hypothetical protein
MPLGWTTYSRAYRGIVCALPYTRGTPLERIGPAKREALGYEWFPIC